MEQTSGAVWTDSSGLFFRRQYRQVHGEVPSQYFSEPVKQTQSKWCEEFKRLFEGAREGTFYQLEASWCQLSLNVQAAGRKEGCKNLTLRVA